MTNEAPPQYSIAQDIDWSSPLIEVRLRVELPFWLMVNNVHLTVEVEGHPFPVSINGETFELQGGEISDSKRSSVYQGPLRKLNELGNDLQQALQASPELSVLWRKCKTVLIITTQCNESVWRRSGGSVMENEENARPAAGRALSLYLEELCRAHLPVINRLIQIYRLATYDYFAFEVAPWDVPAWHIHGPDSMVKCLLVPYRGWDHKPGMLPAEGEPSLPYQLIDGESLQNAVSITATSGELELLDALNLMERGDYSGAVRRVTTAIEVVVEALVMQEVERVEGRQAAEKFIKDTRMNFYKRVEKCELLLQRSLSAGQKDSLDKMRKLRHRIVHGGHRISSGERGVAQRIIDTGRWLFNWFENDSSKVNIREKRIAYRSLGRDITYGIFRSAILPGGVIVSSH